MKASLFKIVTDHEGESKITFCAPQTELAEVVKLNLLFNKLLELNINEATEGNQGQEQDTGLGDMSIVG